MAAHNYDGDMLTDEVAQVHRSPGFITSNLIGKAADGSMIKEFEASHGTVADMWEAHLRGEETSLNPLGMAEALIGAIDHAADLAGGDKAITEYTVALRQAIHTLMVSGRGTRDLCGPSGLTTEQFVDAVAGELDMAFAARTAAAAARAETIAPLMEAPIVPVDDKLVDEEALKALFEELDSDGNGSIDFGELKRGLRRLGVAPRSLSKLIEAGEAPRPSV